MRRGTGGASRGETAARPSPRLAGALLALLLAPRAASPLAIAKCVAGSPGQQWTLAQGLGAATSVAVGSGGCLASVDCAPQISGAVGVVVCGSRAATCPRSELWTLDAQGRLASSANASTALCVTLHAVVGPDVDLWPCAGAQANGEWDFTPPGPPQPTTLQSKASAAGEGCLSSAGGPGNVAIINASEPGRKLYGIGGLAAIGGARLIYEYVEPQRTQILDLLFDPSGGTAFQVLKTEIEGDMDSSYGSGPSFRHSRGEAPSFKRGIYLPFLLGEAKRRNAAIGTYALAWGMPGWVGNGTFLSTESLNYHMDYFNGVRATYGYTFDLAGIHNEREFSRNWVIGLRAALDAAGFSETRVSVGDRDNGGCTDCGAFPDDSITTAAANDPQFADALGVIGLHSLPSLGSVYDWEAAGKDYINSENNDVDGSLLETGDGSFPQWAPNDGSPLGPGLEWPQRFLLSYLAVRATGTIICPLSHAWTWGYGRHNHGTALFVRPWDGHYVLGAAFWTQAHFTQATRPGWSFLDGSASGSWDGGGGSDSNWLTYATLVSPGLDAFSIVAVNADSAVSAPLSFKLVGVLAAAFSGTGLATWLSNSSQLFEQGGDTPIGTDGAISFVLPPRHVLTLTTLRTLAKREPPVPARAPFPLPYFNDFEAQRLEEPGRLLSDLFGAYYAASDPLGLKGQVLKQAVPAPVGSNSWLGRDGAPFTSLPAPGTAFANANVSASVLLTAADLNAGCGAACAIVALCGRVPIWQPAYFAASDHFLGVCLMISAQGLWNLNDTFFVGDPSKSTTTSSVVLASGALPSPILGAWHTAALAFVDDTVTASIDGAIVAAPPAPGGGKALLHHASGLYGLGSRYHTAYFDDLRLAPSAAAVLPASSFLFDVIPGENRTSTFTGWAGFSLDLRVAAADLTMLALGRFRAAGNSGAHSLDVVDAATGLSVLPGGAPVAVDLSAGGCPHADLNGFCYSAPIAADGAVLRRGGIYYVVSSETAGGDVFVSMYDAAAATTHVHRDGTTLMSYAGPGKGVVAGRVLRAAGAAAFECDGLIELMHGPLNLLLA